MKAQLDGTIWYLLTQANMALIWMTRKGSWVQVPHGPRENPRSDEVSVLGFVASNLEKPRM
jgi:hypothetical protein